MVNITKLPSPEKKKIGYAVEKTREKVNVSDENEVRFLRYQMQAVARHMLPSNRVRICLRHQKEKYGTVDVFKHRQTQKAFYGGLMVCGSVWICPVCAAKISERRRVELRQAFDAHRADGGFCTMITLTFSHGRSDRLEDSLKALGEAVLKFRSGKAYNSLRAELGLIGSIRALEVTYGDNGWHPHIHLLNMHTNEIDPWDREDYEERFYNLWKASCKKVGLTTSREHGLKLDDAAEADQYIGKWGDLVQSKWGVDSEMTKANIKKGRAGSLTPFDFLRLVIEDGDLEYTPQFKEYADAMRGKTQLYWSRGLKQKFALEEKTDEQLAESKEELADLLGGIDWNEWRYIIHHDYRAKLLNLIEQHGLVDALKIIGIKRKTTAGNGDLVQA